MVLHHDVKNSKENAVVPPDVLPDSEIKEQIRTAQDLLINRYVVCAYNCGCCIYLH